MTSRGIRNNNPGNLDRNGTKWQGMAEDQSGDPRFVVFVSPEYGIRAMAKLLLTYQSKYGLDTVRKIIGRWAPPVENNTEAYVQAVAKACGVRAEQAVDLDAMARMLPMVKGIIAHENGQQPYADAVLVAGLRLAGVADAPESPPTLVVTTAPAAPKPLARQTSFVTKVLGTVSLGGAAAGQLSPHVKEIADQFTPYAALPVFQRLGMVLMAVSGGLLAVSIVSSTLKQKEAVRVAGN